MKRDLLLTNIAFVLLLIGEYDKASWIYLSTIILWPLWTLP